MEGDTEAQLRVRLFEVESAMDEARRDPDESGLLGRLAEQRDEIKERLSELLPPDAALGYQGGNRPFSKADHDGEFIPQIGESAGGGAG